MSATIQELIQARIEAEEQLAAIEYGIRSIRLCGSSWRCTGIHAGQLAAATAAAAETILARPIQNDNGMLRLLIAAKKAAAERLAAAKAACKAIGNARQLRLALAA